MGYSPQRAQHDDIPRGRHLGPGVDVSADHHVPLVIYDGTGAAGPLEQQRPRPARRFLLLEARSEPQVYLPYKQVPDGSIIFYAPKDLVVRSSQDPDSLIPDIRRIVREADPELPVSDIRLLADIVDSETAPRRTQIIVLAAFAALSMLLAGIGIHSLLSFGVSQRTGEIGVRMAMGARSGDILRMVFREGVLLAVVGGVVGLGAAYTAGRMMEALLAGVRPGDAVTFLAAVGLALAMTVTGSLLPALRAARVDPTEALRAE